MVDVTDVEGVGPSKKRTRLVRPYPIHSLESALAIARAICDSNGCQPFDRILLAKALNTTPASSGYTMLLNSSAKYGLTQGGYNDERILLTARGESIVAPKTVSEKQRALLAAALQPEMFQVFYHSLDGRKLPEDEYAKNMLLRDSGLQPELADECLSIIKLNGTLTGILGEVGGYLYVSKSGAHSSDNIDVQSNSISTFPTDRMSGDPELQQPPISHNILLCSLEKTQTTESIKQIFDSFGIHCDFIKFDDIHGELIHPSPKAVSQRCSAAVIVVEPILLDSDSNLPPGPDNDSFMFFLGAVAAVFGNRVILFAEHSSAMPFSSSSFPTINFDPQNFNVAFLDLLKALKKNNLLEMFVTSGATGNAHLPKNTFQ